MEVDVGEALRYLGAGDHPPRELRLQAEKTAAKLAQAIKPRYVYRVFELAAGEEGIRLAGTDITLTGKLAQTMLASCGRAALLACTLGSRFDAMLRAEEARDMAAAALLNACGSAYVESGCDAAEREVAARFPALYLTDRFSPGYGDLPLSLQGAVCRALDAERRLGIHVGERFWMNPVKSVTAVIGISDKMQMARIRGCAVCAMREKCMLRKGGTSCGL